jgi:NAD(P)-dependent dehydrogenase (short-subunit alcohol dehydrogenase family)
LVPQQGAIITGAAKRVGAAIALGLAKRGFDIALHYHGSEVEALETQGHINSLGRRCVLLKADFFKASDSLNLVAQAAQGLGQIDLLVNNASIFNAVGFLDTSEELFDRNIAVHLKAPFFITSEFAKICQRGNVINIIDTTIVRRNVEYFAYSLSKKALFDFTELAAKALAPNIRVNALAPAAVSQPVDEAAPHYQERRAHHSLLKIPGDPEYLLKGIDFFLDNPFVTGECIFVDGGDHIDWD